MMIRCWPSVAKLYEPHEICENRVIFVNVKPKYRVDEDLTVNYRLEEEFRSSTRDWIGIFPRNWLNLQQYLTFEYTPSSPPNSDNPLNRTITFPRIFHREASTTTDYQFVYVSREIQIMAVSPYFCFIPSAANTQIQRCLSKAENLCPTIELISPALTEDADALTKNCPDEKMTSIKKDDPMLLDIFRNKNNTNGLQRACQFCHSKNNGFRFDALRGDFLASFSDSLLDRVRRLERDLSLAESNLKNAKNSRENINKRLAAYEAFVTEMLSSVGTNGFVKITDEKGCEIVLQRAKEKKKPTVDNPQKNNDLLMHEIISLKNIIQKQQKTIEGLIEQRNFYIPRRERVKFVDRTVQTDEPSQSKATSENEENSDEKKEEENNSKEENLNVAEKVPEIPNNEGDTAKLVPDIKSSKTSIEKRIFKIEKPSGILLQGKNVKFAIIRL